MLSFDSADPAASSRGLRRTLAQWRDHVRRAQAPEPPPLPDDWFSEADVAGLDAALPADDPQRIDDATSTPPRCCAG